MAISEFGPRAIVYHEGSRYLINRVILPIRDDELLTTEAKQCDQCGYLHPISGGPGPDLCDRCGNPLPPPLRPLLRMQNVATKRRDKINCDEEERLRLGYEICTGVRLAEQGGVSIQTTATLSFGEQNLAATDLRPGCHVVADQPWLGATAGTAASTDSCLISNAGSGPRTSRSKTTPKTRCRPAPAVSSPTWKTGATACFSSPCSRSTPINSCLWKAALKNAIQVCYQLEDNELATELLPNRAEPRLLLLYESAEGGAGVLRRLLEDPRAFAQVAKTALEICHFDPDSGEDRGGPDGSGDRCEAACYDCLMHYGNQPVHRRLDRQKIKDVLLLMGQAETQSAPGGHTRSDHLSQLRGLAGSDLECRWLDCLEARNLRLPSHAQHLIESCHTRPDFFYESYQAAIYVDGPPHDFPERARRDVAQTELMEDGGYMVIRFHHQDDWPAIFARYPHIFGRRP